jgi:hypothetical protein
MQRWKNFVWISAGILIVGTIATSLAPEAIAQIRAALVRDMDGPVRGIRHVEEIDINLSSGQFLATETITPTIPAGKKFFVQSASVHLLLTDGQSPMETSLDFNSSVPADHAIFYFDMDFQAAGSSSNPQRHFTGNLPINLLLSQGEDIRLRVFRNDDEGQSSLNFGNATIAGYLVDANP